MATNSLDAVLAQYEQSKQGSSSSTSKFTQEERMKKYFAAILQDKETQGQRRLRILPTKDGSSPFKEVWYHEIQVDGKFQKFYDPGKNDNERSPLTEVYEELRSTGKEADKKLARTMKRFNMPTEVTIVQYRRVETDKEYSGESSVEWSHRWIVRGHWRWQPYKTIDGKDDVKRIWIAPFMKGPDDKPLILTDKIYALVQ